MEFVTHEKDFNEWVGHYKSCNTFGRPSRCGCQTKGCDAPVTAYCLVRYLHILITIKKHHEQWCRRGGHGVVESPSCDSKGVQPPNSANCFGNKSI